MGCVAPCFPIPARPPVVRGFWLAALSTACLLWWWFAYDAYARDIFIEGAYVAASGGIAAVVVAVAMSVWRAREMKRITTYGSARWAEVREIREAGLLGHDGTLLGRWREHYLRHDGPSMSCVSRRPAPAKASVSSSRRF